jgi:acyl-CoA thioesterase
MSHDAGTIAQLSADALWAEDKATQGLGIDRISVTPGRAVLAMTIMEHMVNGYGVCHGGFIFMLADSAFGYACNSYNQRTVAQSCQIAFVAPGRLGMRLVAEAAERQRAERSGIYDVTVRSESGETIAELRGYSRSIRGTLIPT